MHRPTSLNRRINQPSSAINQLRKVLQSVHLNQRVVSVTVEIESKNAMKHVPVSIDGVKLHQSLNQKINKIEISRVFKYQDLENY